MNLNVAVFHDTQVHIHNDPELLKRTRASSAATRIYEENYRSIKNPWHKDYQHNFQEVLPLKLAQEYTECGFRTAIINAAHATQPGGGTLSGGEGTEEYLCRATNLYNCLSAGHIRGYYERNLDTELSPEAEILPFSDRVIYSPGVVVLKEDYDFYPGYIGRNHQRLLKTWFTVDVISATPPLCLLPDRAKILDGLTNLLKKRLRNLFEVAIEHDVEALILGAYGCGPSFCPPELAAETIHYLLHTMRYRRAFRRVTLAVARTEYDPDSMYAFQKRFPTRIPSPKYRPLSPDDLLRFT